MISDICVVSSSRSKVWAMPAPRLVGRRRCVAYVESIVTADQMGMVIIDILGLMTKIGTVWARGGRLYAAVELLSTVCAEPMSDNMTFTYAAPIRNTAVQTLEELEGEMEADEYAAAVASGRVRSWEGAAKGLMETLGG